MAGTWALNLFDRFHLGHQILIERLRRMPNPVAAVTDGELIAGDLDLASIVQPIRTRVKKLEAYLADLGLSKTIRVQAISSYGELLKIQGSTVFMMFEGPCCQEIQSRALSLRKEQLGLNDRMEYVKPVLASDGGKVSSARIRRGEIDREGRRLKGTTEPPRRLEFSTRPGLKIPKGEVYDSSEASPEKQVVQRVRKELPAKVISVGDVTTASILSQGYTPDVCVVDGTTKRGRFEGTFTAEKEYVIYNPPAMIFPEAWSVMDTAINDTVHSLIMVEGEEDLLGFPAMLLAPKGSVLVYGQPDVGIVWSPVDDENKARAKAYLEDMPVIT